MKRICIRLIRFYKKHISPRKGGACCRFVPSCSTYAIEAYEKRGFFMGTILTIWRILRCNPLSVGGYDPVPEKGFRYRGSREIPPVCDEDGCESGDPCCGGGGKRCAQEARDGTSASQKEDGE